MANCTTITVVGASLVSEISIGSAIVQKNKTATVAVSVNNITDCRGMQFVLLFDPGVCTVENVSAARTTGNVYNPNIQNDIGRLTVVYTDTNSISTTTPIQMVNIVLKAANVFNVISPLALSPADVKWTDSGYVTKTFDTIIPGTFETFLAGDITEDGNVDVSDVVMLADVVVGVLPADAATMDFNADGIVDVSDLTKLADFVAGVISTL